VKSLVWLSEAVLQDCGTRCGADTSMDVRTIHRRVEHEGESFLTITLPSLGEALDRAFSEGCLQKSSTPSFAWHRRGLPEFLRGFLLQVFDPSGRLLDAPSIEAIASLRQICYLFKKVNRDCSPRRIATALERYVEVENELREAIPANDTEKRRAFRYVAGVIWSAVTRGLPYGDPWERLRPKHGPGATAEHIHGNSKYVHRSWHLRLEDYFPFTEFGIGSIRNLGEEKCPLDALRFVEPNDEQPVRVVTVPKTLKGPRIIAIEPVCMQYTQQALLDVLVPLIERSKYTKDRVNFSNQCINRSLAQSSSRSGKYATLDMKDASDRVHKDLVYLMLETVPRLRDYVFATRSTRANVLGQTIELSKFASMGSALCFPMEAMAFFCAIVAHRCQSTGRPLTPRLVYKMSRDVYVYGDDIIVPTHEAPSICDDLETYCLKVNYRKSFWTGKFRESCGMDAYDGDDVTPVYLRHELPTDRRHAEKIVSIVSTANQFYQRGYWHTARVLRQEVERLVGRIPFGSIQSQGLCWVSYSGMSEHRRWNSELMRFERRALVEVPFQRSDPLSEDHALLKCFSLIGSVSVSVKHLLRSVARGRLALKVRWVPAL